MLNSISRSALYKLLLALFFVVLFGAGVPALKAQTEGLTSQVGPTDAQAVQDTPTVQFSADTYTESEGVGAATITVTLSEPYTDTTVVSVNYTMNAGTAEAGSDYVEDSGTVEIPAGETSGTFDVSIVDDDVDESLEDLTLTLSDPINADLGSPNPATLEITDNDLEPTMQFSGTPYSVGEANSPAVITVELSAASEKEVTVDFATSDGTATVGSDYTENSGTLTFAPGETVKTFPVTILDDAIVEDDETVILTLSNVNNASISGTNPQTLTIVDDDTASIIVDPTSLLISETAGADSFNISLSSEPSSPVQIGIFSLDTSECSVSTSEIALNRNNWSGGEDVTVTAVDDDVVDGTQTCTVRTAEASSGDGNYNGINPDDVTVTVNDDDTAAIVVEPTSLIISEPDGFDSFNISLTSEPVAGVTIGISAGNNECTVSTNSVLLNDVNWATGADVIVTAVDDAFVDGARSCPVETAPAVSTDTNYNTVDPANVNVTVNDDDSTTVQFSSAAYSVNESGGSALVTVTLSRPSLSTIDVNYATSNGTATAGSDYTATSGSLRFIAGDTSESFTVPISNDTVPEGDETINLTLSLPPGESDATLGAPSSATLTILDDEAVPTVQFSQANFNVPEASLTGNMTVTLSTPSALTVTVNYTMTNGTATTGEDYAPAGGTLTFAPGQVSRSIVVSILPDDIDEADETVILNLSDPVNATLGIPASGTLTILDDDLPPSVQFAAASQSASEADGTTNVTVQLSAASGRTVTVNYATTDGTAKAGSDYGLISGTLVFNPGERSKTISVPIIDDDVDEPNESFVLALSNPVNATLGTPGTVTVTIFDSDLPIFTRYFPAMFYEFVVGEPNDTCGTAYPIEAGLLYSFLPDDQHDWYQFDLATSGNLVVEVTNFVPLKGQVAVYRGANCGSVTFLGNYGLDGTTKRVSLGLQTAGHYYVYVSNDGVLNDTAPYQLYVRFP